jgi:hypothetical protein
VTKTQINALLAGKQPPFNPFVSPTTFGLAAMPPGRYQLLRIDPKPGPFALLSFVPDDQNGLPHAFLGMHKVVRLH